MWLSIAGVRGALIRKPARSQGLPLSAMIVKYILPLVALGLLIFAVKHVISNQPVEKPVEPPVQPTRSPFAKTLAGAGMIEAQSENIAMGTPLPGVVVEVYVKEQDRVKVGQPLFKLDDRQLQADLGTRKASLAAAQSELIRMQAGTRKEQVDITRALVAEARANLADAADELRRAEGLASGNQRVMTEQELNKRRQAYKIAEAKLLKAERELTLQERGSWQYDIDVAAAAVKQAEAQVAAVQQEIERLTVKSLVDGQVLQVNVRPGEFVGTPPSQPLVLLGNIDRLHVRVDIDEQDIPRFVPGNPAVAMLKGYNQERFDLTYVGVEPYVLPKKSLTGQNTERVDTRVLQIIYALEPKDRPLFVGQQLDVYIDADRKGAAKQLATQSSN